NCGGTLSIRLSTSVFLLWSDVFQMPQLHKHFNVGGYTKNLTHKILHWKIKVILFYIVAGFIIGYPFFSIKYFETFIALKITLKFFLPPIVILLLLLGPKFYFKKVKPHDMAIPKSKAKEKARDIFAIVMAIICFTMILCGIAFSSIITTNKYLGKSEIVMVK